MNIEEKVGFKYVYDGANDWSLCLIRKCFLKRSCSKNLSASRFNPSTCESKKVKYYFIEEGKLLKIDRRCNAHTENYSFNQEVSISDVNWVIKNNMLRYGEDYLKNCVKWLTKKGYNEEDIVVMAKKVFGDIIVEDIIK